MAYLFSFPYYYRVVFLNRRDASRYWNLETFLAGLEIFLKIPILLILAWIWL